MENYKEMFGKNGKVVIEPADYLVLKQNDRGFWVSGPNCDLPSGASDALIGEWLKLHGLAAEEIDRKNKPIVIWTKKGNVDGNRRQ